MVKRIGLVLVIGIASAVMGSGAYGEGSYKYEKKKPNLLYLRNMTGKPWWDKKFTQRIPVLISEPVGLVRHQAPVSIVYGFAQEVNPDSLRIVTTWGKEIPSQVKVLEDKKIEVIFSADLDKYEQRPLFIYFSEGGKFSPPSYETDLGLEDKDKWYRVSNDHLKIEILKVPAQPRFAREGPAVIKRIQIAGSHIDNELNPRQPGYSWAGHALRGLELEKGKVVEDGPIRKTIEFKGKKANIRYSLYCFSKRVDFQIFPISGELSLVTHTGWTVYGDMNKDSVYYESSKGIKKLRGCPGAYGFYPKYTLTKWLKEGWVAIADERGEAAANFFEVKKCGRCHLSLLPGSGGESIHLTHSFSKPIAGALVALRGDVKDIRRDYVAWKNPPLVHMDVSQEKANILYKVPKYDKDNTRGYIVSMRRDAQREDEYTAEKWVETLLSHGANSVKIGGMHFPYWPSTVEGAGQDRSGSTDLYDKNKTYVPEMVTAAHKRGIAVRMWAFPKRSLGNVLKAYKRTGKVFCPFKDKDKVIRDYVDQAKTGIDLLYIHTAGEWYNIFGFQSKRDGKKYGGHADECKYCQQRFKKRYGMELTSWKSEYDWRQKEKEGGVNTYPRKYLEDEYLQLTKEIIAAVRKIRPEVPIGILCSSSGNLKRDVDIESKAPFVDTLETEILVSSTPDIGHIKKAVKLPMAVFGNDGRALQHHFYFHSPLLAYKVGEMEIPLMFGIKSFCLEGFSSGLLDPAYIQIVGDFYRFLDYTDLENFLPNAVSVKFICILRDKNAYLDDLKRGDFKETPSLISSHENRVRGLCYLNHLPMDIIVNRFFKLEELKKYKLLIIPSDRVLSAEMAKIVERYIYGGGTLLTEGETVNSSVIAKIAGVKKVPVPAGAKETKDESTIKMPASLPLRAQVLPSLKYKFTRLMKIAAAGAKTIAQDEAGEPAVLLNSYGKGKVIYSPYILTDDLAHKEKALFMRKLIELSAGKGPIQVPPEVEGRIEANVLVKDKQYLLGVYNPSKYREMSFKLTLDLGIPTEGGTYKGLDLKGGKEFDYKDGMSVQISPAQAKFYLIGPEELVNTPQAVRYKQTTGYSLDPGMKFFERGSGYIFSFPTLTGTGKKKGLPKTVGVFKALKTGNMDVGAEGIYEALIKQKLSGLQIIYLHDMKNESLDMCDIIVVPNMGKGLPKNLKRDWHKRIRNFVVQGGRTILMHHSIGVGKVAPPFFPEVGIWSGGYDSTSKMRVVTKHPATRGVKVGDIFNDSFWDYMEITPEKGVVLVEGVKKDGAPTPALVAGKVGKGKVILCGMGIGASYKTNELGKFTAFEKAPEGKLLDILINCIQWLAE